jgi:hypothetical protein
MGHSIFCHAQDDAQALFDEGLSDMKAGRLKLGCALIKRSLDVDARPGTMFTLAECYSRGGKSASAVEMYDRFLAVVDAMPADQKSQQEARAALSRSERTRLVALVAWLTVQLPDSAPPGVVVTRDGEQFNPGLFGIATAVDPGPHVFTARVPDGPLTEQRVDIAPGERKSLVLTVQTAEGTVPMPREFGPNPGQEPAETSRAGLTPWFWVAGGVGAAGLITGAVTGAMLLDARTTIKKDCPDGDRDAQGRIVCQTPAGKRAVDRAQNVLAPATTIALGVGAAGAIVAVVLLVTSNAGSGSGGQATQARALPMLDVSPGGATLGFSSTW